MVAPDGNVRFGRGVIKLRTATAAEADVDRDEAVILPEGRCATTA